MSPKAVFFDVDGTMLPFDGVIAHMQKACRHFRVRVLSKEEILECAIGYTIAESMPKLVPETKGIIKEMDDYYRDSYNADAKSIRPYPYAKKVFEYMKKKGMIIGIITTKSRSQALVTLNFYKLPYDVVIAHEDVKKRKPHPEPILKACKKLKLKPKDCVMVGDHPFDMQSAKSAGCMGIGVLTGWGNRKNLKKSGAAFIIKDLRGLISLLER